MEEAKGPKNSVDIDVQQAVAVDVQYGCVVLCPWAVQEVQSLVHQYVFEIIPHGCCRLVTIGIARAIEER